MTTVAPRPVAVRRTNRLRLGIAVGLTLLIAGLTLSLTLALAAARTPSRSIDQPSYSQPSGGPPSTSVDSCQGKLRGPC